MAALTQHQLQSKNEIIPRFAEARLAPRKFLPQEVFSRMIIIDGRAAAAPEDEKGFR